MPAQLVRCPTHNTLYLPQFGCVCCRLEDDQTKARGTLTALRGEVLEHPDGTVESA